jgi:hypothetical protein
MVGEPEGQGQESQQRQRPPPRAMIVRVFRALKRYENRRRRRAKEYATQHPIYERMLARWTRLVGLFTFALFAVGVVTAVIFGRQLDVMQGQLGEMKIAATIQQNELMTKMTMETAMVPDFGDRTWIVTNVWKNAGKTEAREFKGWDVIKFYC